jgi:uncharacterized membrane protein HdeD (DUF308 family)
MPQYSDESYVRWNIARKWSIFVILIGITMKIVGAILLFHEINNKTENGYSVGLVLTITGIVVTLSAAILLRIARRKVQTHYLLSEEATNYNSFPA